MAYYNKNLWILAVFNMAVAVGRIAKILSDISQFGRESVHLAEIRTLGTFLMGVLLILVAKQKIRLRNAVVTAYMTLILYIWLAFQNFVIQYDTIVNAGMMIIGFSTVSIHQYYREQMQWKRVQLCSPQTLDLRVSGPSQLFHPLVIGPHLEINQEIVDAVEHFVSALRELTPLEVYFYSASTVSDHLQETAIEAYREHFMDEERRVLRNLRSRTRRSTILFCVSMTIIFVWSHYDAVAGQSVIWTVLGNMGGFFLWEIGNTHFRHTDDYIELERIMICKDAGIMFM